MLVDFNKIDEYSRIWIYSSENRLTFDQQEYILESISSFVKNWNSHGFPLNAAITILEDYFVVVALDEKKHLASGCSIDSLYREIQHLEKQISVSLLNRTNIYCKINEKIISVPFNMLQSFADKNTLFYDTTVKRKIDLTHFIKPICDGWCAHLIE